MKQKETFTGNYKNFSQDDQIGNIDKIPWQPTPLPLHSCLFNVVIVKEDATGTNSKISTRSLNFNVLYIKPLGRNDIKSRDLKSSLPGELFGVGSLKSQ